MQAIFRSLQPLVRVCTAQRAVVLTYVNDGEPHEPLRHEALQGNAHNLRLVGIKASCCAANTATNTARNENLL